METNYNAEQEAFRDSLRRLLVEKFDQGFMRERWQEDVPHTPELWNAISEMGVPALLVPEAQDGLGMSMVDMGVVMEELGRRVSPAPVLSSSVGATAAAIIFEQHDLLSSLADGSVTASLAFEEEDVDFLSWNKPELKAKNNQLIGKKVFVLDGLSADKFMVTAQDGIYLVDAKAAGVAVEKVESIDASRPLASVSFDNAEAKKIGELSALQPVIDKMIVALCADAVGAAEMALFLTLEYAKEREQFDVPVGSFQAVQHMLAEMFQHIEMAKAGLHYALWCLDQKEGDEDIEEARRAAVMIKAFVCENFPKVGAEAIQIFAGAGFTWEYDIQLYYKRLLSAELLLGNSEVWLEELARIAVDG